MMRRQNKSCDQCRKSKRACDGSAISELSQLLSFDTAEFRCHSCSYCLKTGKHCTFHWARAQSQSTRRLSTATAASLPKNEPHISKRRRLEKSTGPRGHAFAAAISHSLPLNDFYSGQPLLGTDLSWLDGLSTLPDYAQHSPLDDETLLDGSFDVLDPSDLLSWEADTGTDKPSQKSPDFSSDLASYPAPDLLSAVADYSPSENLQDSYGTGCPFSLSPFSSQHMMVNASNSCFISDNLLHIYHDVLEHNLSCWLTEETCPYYVQGLPSTQYLGNRLTEIGENWSNRIYHRVVGLDQLARSTGIINLGTGEANAASKALNLAIMAFASQWAQGSRRERQRYSAPKPGIGSASFLSDDMAEEFDRSIQKSIWDQARKSLQDVAEVESFKVVCAELIFGLCQKPWAEEELSSTRRQPGIRSGIRAILTPRLNSVIASEGTPIYMERAARKIHVLKSRFDSMEARLTGDDRARQAWQGGDGNEMPTVKGKQTVGLLYWLAVMFDTVSSSMNERPVVLTDEECQHEVALKEDASENGQNSRYRWQADLFIQDNMGEPAIQLPRWPCPYEDAAAAATKSAPVKVLLFRHLSYLQNALRRGARGEPVEEIIRSTTSLYRYWNMTYGAFFRDLVRYYDEVPSRLRSWFFCISAHWHLAALMVADLIEFVDRNNLGSEEERRERSSADLVERIRRASARELSDLARVACPPGSIDDNMPQVSTTAQLPQFHFAVNEGTILTEPWTMIIIRAFAKAAVMYLELAEDLRRTGLSDCGDGGETCEESLRRCEHCIKALWFLGKKSDMARVIAEILSGTFSDVMYSEQWTLRRR